MKKRSGMYGASRGDRARHGVSRSVHGADQRANVVVRDTAGERKTQASGSGGNRRRANRTHGKAAPLKFACEMNGGFVGAQNDGHDVRGAGAGVESALGEFRPQMSGDLAEMGALAAGAPGQF